MTTATDVENQEHPNDEAPANKGGEVIATKVAGTVKWFNVKRGYGFINRNDTNDDIFIHQTAIKKNNPKKYLRSVGDGEVVEFDVIQGQKGLEAGNVTGPDGTPVEGSKYAPFRRSRYPRGSYRGRRGGGPRRQRRPTNDERSGQESGEENGEEVANDEKQERSQRGRPRRYRNPSWSRRRRGPPKSEESGGDGTSGPEDSKDKDQKDDSPRKNYRRPRRYRRRQRPPPKSSEDDGEHSEGDQGNKDNEEGERKQRPRQNRRRRSQGEKGRYSKEKKIPNGDVEESAPSAATAANN